MSFLGFVVAVGATVFRRWWQAAFLASVVAALVTLFLVLSMPSVWLDLFGAVIVWAVAGWSFFTRHTWREWSLIPKVNARPVAS